MGILERAINAVTGNTDPATQAAAHHARGMSRDEVERRLAGDGDRSLSRLDLTGADLSGMDYGQESTGW
jgi:hypothetical protein